MAESARVPGSDDISLFEMWRIILCWKWLVVTTFLLTLGGAVAYLLAAQPVYESEAALYIGQSEEGRPLENPATMVNRLQRHADAATQHVALKASSDRKDARLVTVKVRSNTPDDAYALAVRIVSELREQHGAKYQELVERRHTAQEALKRLLAEGQSQLARAEDTSVSPEAQVALLTARMNLTSHMAVLQDRALTLEQDSLVAVQTEVLKEPALPAKPVRPKAGMILVLAVALGIFLGVFAAFTAQFMAAIRGRI